MQFNFNLRLRLGLPASFAAVVIAILFGIYDAQGWHMYDPVAAILGGDVGNDACWRHRLNGY